MSFSEDIRSEGGFQRQFSKQKRRIQLSEIPKADRENMQEHVVEMRGYAHFLDTVNSIDNQPSIPNGPHDYVFEPDYSTVRLRTVFACPYGIGMNGSVNVSRTLNGVDYLSAKLENQAFSTASLWYSVALSEVGGATNFIFDTDDLWKWKVGFHPPQLQRGNSISLNVGEDSLQMFDVSDFTNFDFTATNFSIGFWIYPLAVFSTISPDVVAYMRIDSNNLWSIEIDLDGKIFVSMLVGGVLTRRQYDTVLSTNTWYFIAVTWNKATNTLTLKVNDNADTSSTKTRSVTTTAAGFFFGSYPGATNAQEFQGYLTGLTYYNATVLNSTELTSLYNYNTKHATTKPAIAGLSKYG